MDEGFDGIGNERGTLRIQMDAVGQEAVSVAPGDGGQTLAQHEAPDLDAQIAHIGHPVEGQLGFAAMRSEKFIHAFVYRQVGYTGLAGHFLDDAAVGLRLAIGLMLRIFPERRQRQKGQRGGRGLAELTAERR